MEQLAGKISEKISVELKYDEEKTEVIKYGLTAIIQIIVLTVLLLVIGGILGIPGQALIICYTASLLRKSTGGAHANSIEACTIIGVVVCISLGLLVDNVFVNFVNIYSLIALIIGVFSIGFYMCYKYVPVDTPTKRIKTEKKKLRMKRQTRQILLGLLCISILFTILETKLYIYRSLNLSIIVGTAWQLLTLSKLGHIIIEGINRGIDMIIHKR